jgi:hypothetical protein
LISSVASRKTDQGDRRARSESAVDEKSLKYRRLVDSICCRFSRNPNNCSGPSSMLA